jgi:hypothetical protein
VEPGELKRINASRVEKIELREIEMVKRNWRGKKLNICAEELESRQK